jgi:hypothetical protein
MAESFEASPTVDTNAYWDRAQGIFRVPIHGSAEFAALGILPNAPLLLSHLDTTEHNQRTPLGDELRTHLQVELDAALQRHAHQAGMGVTLLTHEQAKAL